MEVGIQMVSGTRPLDHSRDVKVAVSRTPGDRIVVDRYSLVAAAVDTIDCALGLARRGDQHLVRDSSDQTFWSVF